MYKRLGACDICLKIKKFDGTFQNPVKTDFLNIAKFGVYFELCPEHRPQPKTMEPKETS